MQRESGAEVSGNIYLETDGALIIDQLRMVLSGSYINSAVFSVSIGNRSHTGPITAVTAGTPHVITSAVHGLNNGDQIIVTQVQGVTDCKGVYEVANKTTDTFELLDSSGTGTFSLEGTPRWYRAVPGAVDMTPDYVAASRGRYVLPLSGLLPFANRGKYIAVIEGVGFNFHREFLFDGRVWQ